jgi:hypothetical protein
MIYMYMYSFDFLGIKFDSEDVCCLKCPVYIACYLFVFTYVLATCCQIQSSMVTKCTNEWDHIFFIFSVLFTQILKKKG